MTREENDEMQDLIGIMACIAYWRRLGVHGHMLSDKEVVSDRLTTEEITKLIKSAYLRLHQLYNIRDATVITTEVKPDFHDRRLDPEL